MGALRAVLFGELPREALEAGPILPAGLGSELNDDISAHIVPALGQQMEPFARSPLVPELHSDFDTDGDLKAPTFSTGSGANRRPRLAKRSGGLGVQIRRDSGQSGDKRCA